jgi:hypothetical protein
MGKYRHVENGVEIISESEISGDWELVEETTKTTKTTKKTKSEEKKSEE